MPTDDKDPGADKQIILNPAVDASSPRGGERQPLDKPGALSLPKREADSASTAEPRIPPHPASKDPLHGVTLDMMLRDLVGFYGWEEMGRTVRIRCFTHKPSISSSLEFLRKTSWARKKVEDWYRVTRARSGAS
jgi:hypothetical protein